MKLYEIAYILLLISYPVLSGLKDGVTMATSSRPYHRLGFVIRITIILVPVLYDYRLAFYLPLYSAYFWILFDMSWNWSAHKSFGYVGHTADTDRYFGSKVFQAKAILAVASILLLILKYFIL